MSLFLSLFKRSLLRYFFATWSFFLQITGQTFSHFNTSEDRSTVLYHTYLMAHYYHRTGMLQRAGSYYRRLVAKGASAYIYDGYIPLLFDSGDFKTITQIAEEKKSELAPLLENNVQLTLIIAQAYLNTIKRFMK